MYYHWHRLRQTIKRNCNIILNLQAKKQRKTFQASNFNFWWHYFLWHAHRVSFSKGCQFIHLFARRQIVHQQSVYTKEVRSVCPASRLQFRTYKLSEFGVEAIFAFLMISKHIRKWIYFSEKVAGTSIINLKDKTIRNVFFSPQKATQLLPSLILLI